MCPGPREGSLPRNRVPRKENARRCILELCAVQPGSKICLVKVRTTTVDVVRGEVRGPAETTHEREPLAGVEIFLRIQSQYVIPGIPNLRRTLAKSNDVPKEK